MKPIRLVRSASGWYVYVHNVPVVSAGAQVDIDRTQFGKQTVGPKPRRFPSKRAAMDIAHTIGHYMLRLGDFVAGYVDDSQHVCDCGAIHDQVWATCPDCMRSVTVQPAGL